LIFIASEDRQCRQPLLKPYLGHVLNFFCTIPMEMPDLYINCPVNRHISINNDGFITESLAEN
jgi:hypothetical protein